MPLNLQKVSIPKQKAYHLLSSEVANLSSELHLRKVQFCNYKISAYIQTAISEKQSLLNQAFEVMKRNIQLLVIIITLVMPGQLFAQNAFTKARYYERLVHENKYHDFDSILYCAQKQFELATEFDDSLELGRAYLSLAFAYNNLDDNSQSLLSILEARKIFKQVNNESLYAISTLEMASMFREAVSVYFNPDSLLHYTIDFFERNKMYSNLARAYLELGLNFRNKFRRNIGRDSILYYYNKAIFYADKANNLELRDGALNDIADYYLLNPHRNLDTVIYLSSKVINSPKPVVRNQAVAKLNTHLALRQLGDPANVKYLMEGYELATHVRPGRLSDQAARLLYMYYRENEMYDSALYYYQKIEGSVNSKKAAYSNLLMDSYLKESAEAEEKNLLLEDNLSIQKNLNSALIFAFLILVIFIVVVVKNNYIIKKKNDDLRKEKEYSSRLLREIHHRVKNNLQMIVGLLDLQQSASEDETVSVVLNDAGSRVRSIALIHQNLYKGDTDMVSVGFQRYIEELCENLLFTYNMTNKLDVTLDIEEIKMPFDNAVILGLLITELITNVLKHAFIDNSEGKLYIAIKVVEGKVVLQVKDNGIGMPADRRDGASFGLDLINSFVKDLNGELSIENNNGTNVTVSFSDLEV